MQLFPDLEPDTVARKGNYFVRTWLEILFSPSNFMIVQRDPIFMEQMRTNFYFLGGV